MLLTRRLEGCIRSLLAGSQGMIRGMPNTYSAHSWYWPATFRRRLSTSLSNEGVNQEDPPDDGGGYIQLSQPIKVIRNARAHTLIDITNENEDVSDKALSQSEFLQAKQRHFITKEEYENLKPHEIRKHLQSTMKKEDLEAKYGKKLAKKIMKRQQLAQHARVSWNPQEKVAETKIKELSVDDIDIENRPKVEKFHFVNKSIYDMTEDEFYGAFFRDRERKFDGMGQKLGELQRRIIQSKQEGQVATRTRISPRQYWIKVKYVSPSVEEVKSLNSMDLKMVMMNEARKAIAEGTMKEDLWVAFLKRVTELSPRVCVRTLLRFLQIISKVQLKPDMYVLSLVNELHRRRGEFKPKHYVFLFQALGRLRLRDQRLYDDIYEMVLCWPVLRNNFIIKASNAIAKLGATESILLQPLKQVISKRLEGFSATDCCRVKAITVIELFTDDMIVSFLRRCEHHKQHFRHYTRHLEIVELYLRLLKVDLYDKLDDATKQFLIQAREGSLSKKWATHPNDKEGLEAGMEDDMRGTACQPDDEEHMIHGGDEVEGRETGLRRKQEAIECEYHRDISSILTMLDITHSNFMRAGPFLLDIYEPLSNTVIEINTEYQYYHGTTKLTSMARRRHEMISAMGFRLLHIPYRYWRQLEGTQQKMEALRELLKYTG